MDEKNTGERRIIEKKKETQQAVTIPMGQVLGELKVVAKCVVDDIFPNIFYGIESFSETVAFWDGLGTAERQLDAIEAWRDLCSDNFFEANPNVDEILVDIGTSRGCTDKRWAASRK